MQYIYVAVGGGLGAVLRFFIQEAGFSIMASFPLGTLVVNVVGCFLAGLVYQTLPSLPQVAKPFLLGGFLGGFTTFSAFSVEVNILLERKHYIPAAIHWGVGAFVCILACIAGLWLGSHFLKSA